MLIISDFLNNLRNMLLNASLIAMINVLLYIVLISLIIYFINYYKCTNTVVIESPIVMTLMGYRVSSIQVLKSTIVHKFNSMPCTNNFSHWSLKINLKECKDSVIISPSRINNIHLYEEHDPKNPRYTIVGKKLKVIDKNTTLKDIVWYGHLAIKDTIYGYNLHNCQNIVYAIVDNFCSPEDASNYIPLKDKKLLLALKTELSNP